MTSFPIYKPIYFAVIVLSGLLALASFLSIKVLTDSKQSNPKIIEKFQCNRCHVSPSDFDPPALKKNCVGCHQAILRGDFDGSYLPDTTARWKTNVHHLTLTPSLSGIGNRVSREWFVNFLQAPHSIRPNLGSSMPRLPISQNDAELLADLFFSKKGTAHSAVTTAPEEAPRIDGNMERGRKLLESKYCGGCHLFSGVNPLPIVAPELSQEQLTAARKLAPDLIHVRERMSHRNLARWLNNPAEVTPETLMPRIPLNDQEILDISKYILETPLTNKPAQALPSLLPPLTRPVSFLEVQSKVFRKICWHCHSDPIPVGGDGGPGNTGGFGYLGKGLDLGSYRAILHGTLGSNGQRVSVLSIGPDRLPRIVRHMLARHYEVNGRHIDGVLGMPLGLTPIPIEDIQLVHSWILQGAKSESSEPAKQTPER